MFREKKRGPGDAKNTGLKRATGKYICFVDADDYLPDEKIIAKFLKDLDISSDDYITVAELSTTFADGLTKTIDTNTALISDTL